LCISQDDDDDVTHVRTKERKKERKTTNLEHYLMICR